MSRLCFDLNCLRSGSLRALHSFPTRRSSDLRLADRLPACDRVDSRSQWLSIRRKESALDSFRRIESHCERSEEHTSELQSHVNLVCRLLLEKKKSQVYSIKLPARAGRYGQKHWRHVCLTMLWPCHACVSISIV